MSVLAVEEYEELHENFELEKNLRKKAESFAQEVSSQGKNADIASGQNFKSLDGLDFNSQLSSSPRYYLGNICISSIKTSLLFQQAFIKHFGIIHAVFPMSPFKARL